MPYTRPGDIPTAGDQVYRDLSIVAIIPVWNEKDKIATVLQRIPSEVVDEVLVIDDGSTDGSAEICGSLGATVLRHERCSGVGASLRDGYAHATAKGFDVAVVMAGNNKDAPEEIPRLLDPIAEGRADFVQGSRYLDGKRDMGAMPLYRRLATRFHPWLFSRISGVRVTESTNGFRAIHSRVLADERLELGAPELDGYGLEPHLYLRSIRLGYRITEVSVTKRYPPRELGQTKMRPILDWWAILRPLFSGDGDMERAGE